MLSLVVRKNYDKQFKSAIVRLVLENYMSISNVAKKLFIHCKFLYRWISEYEEYRESAV